jgi:excisionase family DNA binding protein
MNLDNQIEKLPLSLTVSDISRILGISKQNAYNLCHSEGFPSVQIGKRLIIPKLAFVEWLKNPNIFKKGA